MTGKQILLLWGDPKERRTLYKILCATGADVRFANAEGGPDASETVIDPNCRLVVIDYDSARDDARRVLDKIARQPKGPAVLVVTASRDKNELIDLFSHQSITNLIAKNTDLLAAELIVTVQKIMHNDVFGLEKYLTWGVFPRRETVTSSARKNDLLDGLEEYLNVIGANRRLIGLAKGVADEFLMNAIYNAPVDASGKIKYASRSRAERVELAANEHVQFSYACDGRLLALSVVDNFGRLERSTVLGYLRKCFVGGDDQIDQKEGGAGLGLYAIFTSLNQFIINVAPQKRTEMIGIIDISGSFRDFAEQPKSLNIFLQEGGS